MAIRKAEKVQAKLRLAILGPSGSGKTFTALAFGQEIAKAESTKMGVIDTERNSACLYSDKYEFDVEADMGSFNPKTYVEKIGEFGRLGYGVLVIDGLSPAWSGKDGALEMVDKAASRNGGGNKFAGWRDVTPLHNQMIDAILQYPGHVIATMRSKMEYIQEKNEQGKTVIRKVGMQPIQREGMEYEFTVVGDMDQDHRFIVTKSRCAAIADGVYLKPGGEIAKTLLAWLNDGVAMRAAPIVQPVEVPDETDHRTGVDPLASNDALQTAIDGAFMDRGISTAAAATATGKILAAYKVANLADLTLEQRHAVVSRIQRGGADHYKTSGTPVAAQ